MNLSAGFQRQWERFASGSRNQCWAAGLPRTYLRCCTTVSSRFWVVHVQLWKKKKNPRNFWLDFYVLYISCLLTSRLEQGGCLLSISVSGLTQLQEEANWWKCKVKYGAQRKAGKLIMIIRQYLNWFNVCIKCPNVGLGAEWSCEVFN